MGAEILRQPRVERIAGILLAASRKTSRSISTLHPSIAAIVLPGEYSKLRRSFILGLHLVLLYARYAI